MFVTNDPDTASRPAIIMMPGQGEQGTSDTNKLVAYGPHYWLNHGWDGGLQLGNGKHYPILITAAYINNVSPTAPQYYTLLTYLLNTYHIKRNAVHFTGLSQGAMTTGELIKFEMTAGAETGMKLVTSFAALEGTPGALPSPYNGWDRDTVAYKVWAKKYGGKYFYLEGSGSDNFRDGWHYSVAMNDTLPGCAYFSYENLGGGAHCCWNSMYDPNATNWTCVGTLGPNNAPSQVGKNTMGTYFAQSSIFQWMLRQGDTSLVGVATPSPRVVKKVVVSEYRTWYYLSDSTIWGYNNSSAYPVQYAPPSGRKWCFVFGGFNIFNALDDLGYVWQTKAFNFDITTNTYRVDTDTTGGAFSGNIYVDGYSNAILTIRSDSSIWYGGKDVYSLFYPGGSTVTSVGQVMKFTQLSPAGLKFKKVVCGGPGILALTTDGKVYKWSNGGSKTPTLYSTPRPAIDIFISALNLQGCIIPDVFGSQTMGYPYVWGGTTSMYGGGPAYSQPTSIKALWNITVPIKEISVDWNTIHYIDSLGRMWGCGFNSFGEVGNGQEFVNKYYYPGYPGYGWSLINYENPSGIPVQIKPGTLFKHIWSTTWFGLYKYAQDLNDSIYSWGRNKALALGNGYGSTSETDQYHPNTLDVLVPKRVTPLTARFTTYNFTAPTLSAGANKTITSTSTTLTATGNPALVISQIRPAPNGVDTVGYWWISYAWTKVSGPNNPTIVSPSSKSTSVTGMVNGTYVFQVLATDNNTGQDTSQVQVIVNQAGVPPTVYAGINQSTTLPKDSATLTGTASGNSGATITSTSWSQVSGPNTATIRTPSSLSTVVAGLIAGTYTFKLTATDSNSQTANDTVTVTVSQPQPTVIEVHIRKGTNVLIITDN
ncbi:MAG: hypothetical protein BGO55_00545 [Sphingobacteriales bacterium 50-39]|nr:MAG: hypothetical protein BGO55_00545 [Sphingobacteriales bacterium 50-39]